VKESAKEMTLLFVSKRKTESRYCLYLVRTMILPAKVLVTEWVTATIQI
jgi:hypothetical protein